MNCEANRNLKVMASPCCIKIPFSFYELHDAYMMAVHTSIAGWQNHDSKKSWKKARIVAKKWKNCAFSFIETIVGSSASSDVSAV